MCSTSPAGTIFATRSGRGVRVGAAGAGGAAVRRAVWPSDFAAGGGGEARSAARSESAISMCADVDWVVTGTFGAVGNSCRPARSPAFAEARSVPHAQPGRRARKGRRSGWGARAGSRSRCGDGNRRRTSFRTPDEQEPALALRGVLAPLDNVHYVELFARLFLLRLHGIRGHRRARREGLAQGAELLDVRDRMTSGGRRIFCTLVTRCVLSSSDAVSGRAGLDRKDAPRLAFPRTPAARMRRTTAAAGRKYTLGRVPCRRLIQVLSAPGSHHLGVRHLLRRRSHPPRGRPKFASPSAERAALVSGS